MGQTGSEPYREGASGTVELPRISIVTPSYNQGAYLDTCLRSVLDQGYPNLEYIVIDGGSTDGSVEIIRRHADRLAYWCSEPDAGQYDALNKGFARATGEILAWLNADDLYCPWALHTVATVFRQFPAVSWVTSLLPAKINRLGVTVGTGHEPGYSRTYFMKGFHLRPSGHYCRDFIQQESTFWRRSLWDVAGGRLDTQYPLAADFELWARFFQHAPLHGLRAMLGGFRVHGDQRSLLQRTGYLTEAHRILSLYGGRPCGRVEGWLRRVGAPGLWPLRVLPSLGLVQPAEVIRWDSARGEWTLRTVLI